MANFDGARHHALKGSHGSRARTARGNHYEVVHGTLESRLGQAPSHASNHAHKVQAAHNELAAASNRSAAARKAWETRRNGGK